MTITKANIIAACSPIIGQASLFKDFKCDEQRHLKRMNQLLASLIRSGKIRRIDINGMPFYESISASDHPISSGLGELPVHYTDSIEQTSSLS